MKRKNCFISTMVSVSLIMACFLLLNASSALAGAKMEKIEGAKFNLNFTLKDNLLIYKGKKISVTMLSGEKLSGKVVDANGSYLHLEKLERLDFYDALIRIDNIESFRARFREYK